MQSSAKEENLVCFKDKKKASSERRRVEGDVSQSTHLQFPYFLHLAGSVEAEPESLSKLCPLVLPALLLPHTEVLGSGPGRGGLLSFSRVLHCGEIES